MFFLFFWKSTTLGTIFHQPACRGDGFEKSPIWTISIPPKTTLLDLCFHGHIKNQTRSTKAVAAQNLGLQIIVCRKRKAHTANRKGWLNGKKILDQFVQSTTPVLNPSRLLLSQPWTSISITDLCIIQGRHVMCSCISGSVEVSPSQWAGSSTWDSLKQQWRPLKFGCGKRIPNFQLLQLLHESRRVG